jgi:hypothetical protein
LPRKKKVRNKRGTPLAIKVRGFPIPDVGLKILGKEVRFNKIVNPKSSQLNKPILI